MNVAAISHPQPLANEGISRSDAVLLLQGFVIALMVIPSDTVLIGAGGAAYPAALVGFCLFSLYFASVLLGLHHPGKFSHPIQGVLCVIWISVLASYILMDRGRLTGMQLANSDRFLIRFAVVTGVTLVAAEWLRSFEDVVRVVRTLCWAAAFCGFVAVLQFWMSVDLTEYLRQVPGFVVNHDNPAIQIRGSLNRVAGTAITPIELGVVCGMLIPLSLWLGLYEREKSALVRWGPLTLILLGVATSVSRSAVLSVILAFAVLVVLMPPVPRFVAFCALPIAIAALFVSAHGLIGTLASFFASASSDSSIQYRTHDYPLAEALWTAAPWFGHGPGTYLPANPLNVFDNEFLDAAVELGLVGIFALTVFLLAPALFALSVRRRSRDQDFRLLCAALAAAGFAATACSVTFDSLAFPMFVNVYAVLIGLVGACWRLPQADPVPLPDQLWPGRAKS